MNWSVSSVSVQATLCPPPRRLTLTWTSGAGPVGVADYAPFVEGVVDAEEVLVATVRRTWRDLARVDVEVAAARSVTDARRALTVGLRTKHALVRQLRELEAARQPRKRLL